MTLDRVDVLRSGPRARVIGGGASGLKGVGRPPRPFLPDGIYHVTVRGNARRLIYRVTSLSVV
jgi:hypothetical protein